MDKTGHFNFGLTGVPPQAFQNPTSTSSSGLFPVNPNAHGATRGLAAPTLRESAVPGGPRMADLRAGVTAASLPGAPVSSAQQMADTIVKQFAEIHDSNMPGEAKCNAKRAFLDKVRTGFQEGSIGRATASLVYQKLTAKQKEMPNNRDNLMYGAGQALANLSAALNSPLVNELTLNFRNQSGA